MRRRLRPRRIWRALPQRSRPTGRGPHEIACSGARARRCGVAPGSGPGRPASVEQYTIEQFLDTTSINGASFSADESRILFSSNKTGIWNAYTIPVGGGAWTPVTTSTTDSTYAVSFFPKDDRILFTRDQGGNELNHLYVRDAGRRGARPDARRQAEGAVRQAGRPTAPPSTSRRTSATPRFFDIYRYDAKTYARTLFYENKDGYFPAASPTTAKWVALRS